MSTTNDDRSPAVAGPVERPVRPLLAPRDWQAIALREAAELTGTPEGAARLVESKRYGMLADEIERLRGCLLWLLWHHQGASSPTGQPIRRALGIDQHAPMTEAQIEAGQRFGVGA